MSVVVAIKENGRVYLGCDSQATKGGTRTTLKNPNNYNIWNVLGVEACAMGHVGFVREACVVRLLDDLVRDIDVYSLCEHHLLPFFGHCHVGYISRGRVLGVSKIARIVDCLAARLQIQERLTSDIARAVRDETGAEGVGVVMECQHLCMTMRGVEKQNSVMSTSAVLGSFHDDAATRSEFLSIVTSSHHR